jgi:hypothetical protein
MAQYQFTEDQFVRAMAAAGRRIAVMLVAGAVVMAIVAGVYASQAGITPRSLILAAVPVALVFLLWRRRLRWRRVFRQTPALQRQQTFLPDNDGYTIESYAGKARISWQETWRVTLSPEVAFLWMNETTFRIVPLEALSPEELEVVQRQAARPR